MFVTITIESQNNGKKMTKGATTGFFPYFFKNTFYFKRVTTVVTIPTLSAFACCTFVQKLMCFQP